MASPGAVAFHLGPLLGVALARYRRLPVLRSHDVAAPSIALGQANGRWGKLFDEEAFGRPTARPWKLYISIDHRPPVYPSYSYVHPPALYESIWELGVFLTLVLSVRVRLHARPGALFLTYLGLYSLGRMLIEGLRLDSFWLGGFRVAQARWRRRDTCRRRWVGLDVPALDRWRAEPAVTRALESGFSTQISRARLALRETERGPHELRDPVARQRGSDPPSVPDCRRRGGRAPAP